MLGRRASLRLCAILFPFTWQHVYIPILPARLLDILQARAQFGRISAQSAHPDRPPARHPAGAGALLNGDRRGAGAGRAAEPDPQRGGDRFGPERDHVRRHEPAPPHYTARRRPTRSPLITIPSSQVRRRHRRQDAPAPAVVPQAVQSGRALLPPPEHRRRHVLGGRLRLPMAPPFDDDAGAADATSSSRCPTRGKGDRDRRRSSGSSCR